MGAYCWFRRAGLFAALLSLTIAACAGAVAKPTAPPPEQSGLQAAQAAGFATASPAQMGFAAAGFAKLDRTLQGYVERGQLPGVSVLVARHGKIVHLMNFGYRDIATRAPMRDDTIVRIYSMTKPISAAAVMAAVEDGKFRLGDPVAKYLPEFAHLRVYAGDKHGQIRTVPVTRTMTIAELLEHTSGLTASFQFDPVAKLYKQAGLDAGLWFLTGAIPTLTDFVERLAKLPLVFQPGDRWHYSVGPDVASLIVERTEGMPFGEFVKKRILDPLQMRDTAFYVPAGKLDRFASLYKRGPDGKLAMVESAQHTLYAKPPPVDDASGGLLSTLLDYYRFAQMLCNDGELNGVRVLKPASVDAMLTNHLGKGQFGQLAKAAAFGFGGTGTGIGFGYGGAVIRSPRDGAVGSYLWGGAASTTFYVDRRNGIVAVLMTQLLPSGTYPLFDVLSKGVNGALVAPAK